MITFKHQRCACELWPKNHFVPLRGGPFDTWGGLYFFLRDQTFFFTPSLNVLYKFFQTYQKQTIFFSAVKLKQFFSPFISFDSPYTMLSSRGVTTFT